MTLRQLLWMIDGKQKVDWNHTAALMTLTANINRGKSSDRKFTPADFHPYSEQPEEHERRVNDREGFELLKQIAGGDELVTRVIKHQDEHPGEH